MGIFRSQLGRGTNGGPRGGSPGALGPVNPTTLNLSGWWKASYSASPWSGNASAGSSGSRSLTEATNPPSAGTAINGLDPCAFDGVNDSISGTTVDNFFSLAAWEVHGFFNPTNALVAYVAGLSYTQQAILCDNANGAINITMCSVGGVPYLLASVSDGSVEEIKAPCSVGANHIFHIWYDGTNLNMTVDGVTATPVATSNFTPSAIRALKVGANYNSSVLFAGNIAELMISNTNLGTSMHPRIRAYFNQRYATSI